MQYFRGADSDIVLDIISKVNKDNNIKYIWFDTGIEYQATKNHLCYLEDKYKIDIIRERAIKPIPVSCKEYGQPFLNKYVSKQISILQKNGFEFKDKAYDVLINEYPNCISSIKWWCNKYTEENNLKKVSGFDIGFNKYLKEFLIFKPPCFKISSKCCDYAKKDVGKKLYKKYNCDLTILGIRQQEGGIRSIAYKNCFSSNKDKEDMYRPIFYYTDKDKLQYDKLFNIRHSDCYEIYDMKRTGCAGCPYGKERLEELSVIKQYEPLMYTAICNIFKESYEYTKMYKDFYDFMVRRTNKIKRGVMENAPLDYSEIDFM